MPQDILMFLLMKCKIQDITVEDHLVHWDGVSVCNSLYASYLPSSGQAIDPVMDQQSCSCTY